jgi:hypothetical protein
VAGDSTDEQAKVPNRTRVMNNAQARRKDGLIMKLNRVVRLRSDSSTGMKRRQAKAVTIYLNNANIGNMVVQELPR